MGAVGGAQQVEDLGAYLGLPTTGGGVTFHSEKASQSLPSGKPPPPRGGIPGSSQISFVKFLPGALGAYTCPDPKQLVKKKKQSVPPTGVKPSYGWEFVCVSGH